MPHTAGSEARFGELPQRAKNLLQGTSARVLRERANPLTGDADVSTEVFRASDDFPADMISVSRIVDGREIRFLFGSNGLRVQIPLPGDEAERRAAAETMIERLLETESEGRDGRPRKMMIPWPETLPDGTKFSTNPRKDIRIVQGWRDRIDFVVENGRLDVLLYNVDVQHSMPFPKAWLVPDEGGREGRSGR